ncbi:MAG: hypothetical protein JO290_06010 [Sphingomonadaceae bacterium]|nr:hypothetical protein [Sphingomonadaceae bacterium]
MRLSRRGFCGAAAATVAVPLRASEGAWIAATDPRLRFEGRTAVTGPGRIGCAFPGIVVRLDARATHVGLGVRSSDATFLDVSIDGGAPARVAVAAGEQIVPLVRDEAARRRIEVVKRNGPWHNLLEFTGVALDGDLLAAPVPPPRRLLFIGDSITCGSNADWPDLTAPEGPEHDDARQCYAAVLARRLGAQRHLVAYGGKGVLRDWQGRTDVVTAGQFYTRALPDDPASRWRATDYVPEAVGICLGTNDFNPGIPDRAAFVDAYLALVAQVRADAPAAPIIVIDSPMTADEPGAMKRTALRTYLHEVVARAASPLVRRGPVAHYPGRPGRDAHPTGEQHLAMAGELEPLFRQALGG